MRHIICNVFSYSFKKTKQMKKLLLFLMLTFSVGIATQAQQKENKEKVKQTSTVPQKVHNTFNKNKKHKGYKVKHTKNGTETKHKVDMKKGEVKTKTD